MNKVLGNAFVYTLCKIFSFRMSEIWLKKMRTFFNSHDFNRDGYIHQETFVGIAHSLANALNTAPDTREKVAEAMNQVQYLFTHWRSHGGAWGPAPYSNGVQGSIRSREKHWIVQSKALGTTTFLIVKTFWRKMSRCPLFRSSGYATVLR